MGRLRRARKLTAAYEFGTYTDVMLASGFHLQFTPGSSQVPAYTSGYELELTNLSDKEIQFDVRARVTRCSFKLGAPESPGRVLDHLEKLIPGVLRNDLMTWFDGGWSHNADGFALLTRMPVAPGTSELFTMILGMQQPPSWWPRVAGYVEVTVPALRSPDPPFPWIPQSSDPVPVLLNPSTVEQWEVPTTGGDGAFANSRTSPPLASGRAYNEIDAGADPGLGVTEE